ncbi:MAG: DnaJ domain-containing protein [Myxococcota bacterium]|nr:DnaJ domain-containing protein [Myxococcota bacterium]MDW8363335.1 DnaJ domain-containing protein [Myxococcales bacterium]
MSGDDPLDALDYYTLLGVDPHATEAQIRAAFRAFARRYHPDRFAGADPDTARRAQRIYRRGAEGLQVLLDPEARRLYHVALRQGLRRLTAEQRDNAAVLLERLRAATEGQPASTLRRASSPMGRAAVQRARQAEARGELRAAWQTLRAAVTLEPEDPVLASELERIEALLRRGGR